jgi:hypothetical protein
MFHGVWHWFSLLCCQTDASRSAHLGYPVGTFPTGGKFAHALPAKHPPEDQFIHLELSALHEPLVVAPDDSMHCSLAHLLVHAGRSLSRGCDP